MPADVLHRASICFSWTPIRGLIGSMLHKDSLSSKLVTRAAARGLNLGAGAFLFTTRRNFEAIGGFDEQYFAGEEVYFSLALRKLGRFKVLREPIVTSGRKLRMYPAKQFLRNFFGVIVGGPRAVRSRAKLRLWYDGKREKLLANGTNAAGSE